MKFAVISDLHIQRIRKGSYFQMSDRELCSFLKDLLREVDMLYINGDFIEFWKGKWIDQQSKLEAWEEVQEEFPKTLSLVLGHPRVTYIRGNHDSYMEKLSSSVETVDNVEIRSAIGKIIISHGVCDYINRKLPKLGEFITWVGSRLEGILSSRWGKRLEAFVRKILWITVFKNTPQLKGMKKMIRKDDSITMVINGHTHLPQVKRFKYRGKERTFVNTGTFNGKELDVALVDSVTGKVVLRKGKEVNKYKELKETLEKGDIILAVNKTSLFSQLIAKCTSGKFSHAFVYLGGGRIVESTITDGKRGVVMDYLDTYMNRKYDLVVLRLYDRKKVDPFIEELKREIGSKYSYFQVAIVAIRYFLSWLFSDKSFRKDFSKDIDTENEHCSELVAKCIKKVTGDSTIVPENTTPKSLEDMSTHLYQVHVIKE